MRVYRERAIPVHIADDVRRSEIFDKLRGLGRDDQAIDFSAEY